MDVRRVSWSLGEIASLCTKAARGAGHPWGIAEEVGWAVRWLSGRGLAGSEACATWLQGGAGACPIRAGLEIRDLGNVTPGTRFDDLAAPGLLLPFVAWALGAGQAVRVTMDACPVILSRDGVDVTTALPDRAAVRIEAFDGEPPAPNRAWRIVDVQPAALALLQSLAQRTYAPASEQSRLLGAGAGLTDND